MCSLRVLICSVAACCFGERISDAVADGDDGLLSCGWQLLSLSAVRRAGRRADVLALMAEAGGALADLETAGLAEIVLPGIDVLRRRLGLCRLREGLRADEGRGLLQRKTDLRIGGEVGAAAAPAKAAVGDDVAAGAIGEIGRSCRRPFGDLGRNVVARPRRLAAGDAQAFRKRSATG